MLSFIPPVLGHLRILKAFSDVQLLFFLSFSSDFLGCVLQGFSLIPGLASIICSNHCTINVIEIFFEDEKSSFFV